MANRADDPLRPDDVRALVADRDLGALQGVMASLSVPELTAALDRLPGTDAAVAFRLLPKDQSIAVFEDLDADTAGRILGALRDETVQEVIAALDPDDRARYLEELPASLVRRLLAGLTDHERRMTEELLGYPPRSAGRTMTPEVAFVHPDATAGTALAHLRATGADAETIYMVPVVGTGRRLLGVVSLRSLLLAEPATPVADLASDPIFVRAVADREVAARLIRNHGMIGLPVVDSEERLVGVITVDDAMRILAEQEGESSARSAGIRPTRGSYLATPVLRTVRSRIVWLLVLIVAATLTVNVLDFFEESLAQVVSLALFIPLLIGTGGNVGAQTVTTVVRALSTQEVRLRDVGRVVARELATGFLLGLVLGACAVVPAVVLATPSIAVVLAISLVAVCSLAAAVGAFVPIAASRAGMDPAVVSAPFITTVVDATGLVVYFLVAGAVLGL